MNVSGSYIQIMHRTSLANLLHDYTRRYPAEQAVIERFLQFVRQHPDCFERSLTVGHVTGSAWVVNQAGTHVLLTHHKKLNRWLQLGGHADGNPRVHDVALREAQEESGLPEFRFVTDQIFDIDIHPIPARGSEPEHFHYDVRFALQTVKHEAYQVSEESHDLAWIEIARIHEVSREEAMLRMARKWQEMTRLRVTGFYCS